jgi:hypothetical protein
MVRFDVHAFIYLYMRIMASGEHGEAGAAMQEVEVVR